MCSSYTAGNLEIESPWQWFYGSLWFLWPFPWASYPMVTQQLLLLPQTSHLHPKRRSCCQLHVSLSSDKVKYFSEETRKLSLLRYGHNCVTGLSFFSKEVWQNMHLVFSDGGVQWGELQQRENRSWECLSGQHTDVTWHTQLLTYLHFMDEKTEEVIVQEQMHSEPSILAQLWLCSLHCWLLCFMTSSVTASCTSFLSQNANSRTGVI